MARHTFFAELYGLNPSQRNAGASAVNNALDLEAIGDVLSREVITDYTAHAGEVALLVNSLFTSDVSGQRIFNAAYNWANSRATTSPLGAISSVRQVTVDEDAGTITTWLSTSPSWPTAVPEVRSLFSLKQ